MKINLEIGKKKVNAIAIDWPGYCRSGKTEEGALEALLAYADRYSAVLEAGGLPFSNPAKIEDFEISERLEGNASSDFGGPGVIGEADSRPVSEDDLNFFIGVQNACWMAFRQALKTAEGRGLRKGPRGGGRDQAKMTAHILESEKAYLRRINTKFTVDKEESTADHLARIQAAGLDALRTAVIDGLPAAGPRGGKIWQPRTYVLRSAWHLLDHVWEIEDKLI